MLNKVKAQAEGLGVPPEIIIADDVFNAYTAIKQYGKWQVQYAADASTAARAYRHNALKEILDKLDNDVKMLRELIDERQG